MQLWKRLLVAAILLVALGGLGVHWAATWEKRWPYPTGTDLKADYGSHVGQETLVFGSVTATGSDTLTIDVETERGTLRLRVKNASADVSPGGNVQVYGTIRPGHMIEADRVVAVNPASGSRTYKYAVSLVGAALVLVVFFRYWRLDAGRTTLEVRERG